MRPSTKSTRLIPRSTQIPLNPLPLRPPTISLTSPGTPKMPSTGACPLCQKRFSLKFLPLHAASCNLPPKRSLTKPRSKPPSPFPPTSRPRPRAPNPTPTRASPLAPRYPSVLPPNSPPSMRAAPGFYLFENAVTHLEPFLLSAVENTPSLPWFDFRYRLTKNYGPVYHPTLRRYLFGSKAPQNLPLPPYATNSLLPLLRTLHPLISNFHPNQLAVSKYANQDSHIKPHNDCETGHIRTAVVGVCLGAACTMTLTLRARFSGLGKDVKRDVRLPRGAVYIMSGDALRVWYHAIFQGKTEGTRVSLTFRDVEPHRPGEADQWPDRRKEKPVLSKPPVKLTEFWK